MSDVKLHTLPIPFRDVISDAEHEVHLAYADAINHELPAFDEVYGRIHDWYTDLCEQASVCCKYGCYERTDLSQYCAEHKTHEVLGL
jgi:hypothetical protein